MMIMMGIIFLKVLTLIIIFHFNQFISKLEYHFVFQFLIIIFFDAIKLHFFIILLIYSHHPN